MEPIATFHMSPHQQQQPPYEQQYEPQEQNHTRFHEETEVRTMTDSLPPSRTHSRAASHTSDYIHPAPTKHATGTPPCPISPTTLKTPMYHLHEKQKMEERTHKRGFSYWWYTYVNPWIRLVFLIPILYFYMSMSSINSYRANVQHDDLIKINNGIQYGDPQISYQYGPNPPVPFALKDSMHENLSAAWGSTLTAWTNWANFVVAFSMVFTVVWILVKRDMIRLTEFIVMEMFLFFWNAVAHVATTYPDPAYYQYDACVNERYHSYGKWIEWMPTLSYCGDHMWSGHTTNTLIAVIMLRRVIWDTLGWNFNRLYPGSYLPSTAQLPFTMIDATGHHQWKWAYTGNDANTINNNGTASTRHHDSEEIAHAAHPQVPWNPDAPAHSVGTSDIELGNAEINKTQAMENTDGNRDRFLRLQRSQYTSPAWVVRHHKLVWYIWTFIRILLPCWHASLCVAVLIIRFHYTADVVVANVVTFTLTCNPYFVQNLVRWFYRPNYWNYQAKHWWAPVYIDNPTNAEQCNYEERVRRCGLGGLF